MFSSTLEGYYFLICCLFLTAASFKPTSLSDVPTKQKDNKIEVGREITIEEPGDYSASTSKGRHFDGKEKGSLEIEGKPQTISADMMKMSLSSKSGNAKDANGERASSNAPFKPEKWMLPDQVEDKLSQLNLAIVSYPFAFSSVL